MGPRGPACHPHRAHHPGRALALPGRHAARQRRTPRRRHQVLYAVCAVAWSRHRHHDGVAGGRARAAGEGTPHRSAGATGPDRARTDWGRECRHRTPAYLDRGIAMAEQRITETHGALHATVYRTFLAVLSVHGRCGCLTDTHIARLFTAAQAKGESPGHCTDAWANARTRLGL